MRTWRGHGNGSAWTDWQAQSIIMLHEGYEVLQKGMHSQCFETSSAMQNRAVDSGNDPVVWHSFGERPVTYFLRAHCIMSSWVSMCVLHECGASALFLCASSTEIHAHHLHCASLQV